jgi:gamma-glutamyltranspeptidase/glutathione hydrolase
MIKRLSSVLLLPLALAACTTTSQQGARQASSLPAATTSGMVSAADPRAAQAGVEILRKGGNATDAALAIMIALTVVEPQSSGIGGGGFYLHADRKGKVETLDGRETAPSAATPDWFIGADGKPVGFRDAVRSGLSTGVPGNIALAAQAHARHGKLAWAKLFEPAIRLARDGWALSPRSRDFLERSKATASRSEAARALYYDAQGNPLPVGTMLRNPELAATLERLAARGAGAFYKREAGASLAAAIARDTPRPAGMTARDVESYQAKWREPVCATYRAHRICGMGPPSSGATTVLAILGQLERFDLSQMNVDNPAFWHVFAESQRLAYADRERFLADSDFISVPVAQLIDRDYLARRGALISPTTRMPSVEPGLALAPPDGNEGIERGTSHFVTVDRWGAAVSYTSTIEGPFGSGLKHEGYYLNNELTDFSFSPEKDGRAVANRVEGGKRPRSSMAPTVIFGPDGKFKAALGAAGGATIPVQVARAIIAMIDWGMPVQQALAVPVLYSPGETVIVEKGSALESMVPALQGMGHLRVNPADLPLKINAVTSGAAGLDGAADPRSEGVALRP